MHKSILAALSALPLAAFAATSTPQGFTDDLDAALARAKADGKYVYACFSGSDWCGWCIRLEKEVFSNAKFAPAVAKDYELVYIDSPRDKSRLSEEAKKRNSGLTKKYQIRGFPSMIVFDGKDGSEVMRGGAYRAGGVDAYIKYLQEVRVTDFKKLNELEAVWLKPLEKRCGACFAELNAAYDKAVDAELAKPENQGKRREELKDAAKPVVKEFLPKFRELQQDAAAKAKEAPAEIRGKLDGFANNLADWLKRIESDML